MLFAGFVVVIAVIGLQRSIGGETRDNLTNPPTDARQGIYLLNDRFASEGGSSGQVAFTDPDGDVADAIARVGVYTTLREIADNPNVVSVSDPFDPAAPSVSSDGRIAYATVRYGDAPSTADGAAAEAAFGNAREFGLQAELSRDIVRTTGHAGGDEGIVLIVALIVVLVVFGSLVAARLRARTGTAPDPLTTANHEVIEEDDFQLV